MSRFGRTDAQYVAARALRTVEAPAKKLDAKGRPVIPLVAAEESLHISSYGYDAEFQMLDVKFKTSGAVYRYFGVPENIYRGLEAARTKGTYVNRTVKGGGFRYERIDVGAPGFE